MHSFTLGLRQNLWDVHSINKHICLESSDHRGYGVHMYDILKEEITKIMELRGSVLFSVDNGARVAKFESQLSWASNMVQQVKVLANRPEDLNLVMWWEERPNLQACNNTHSLSNKCNLKKPQLSLKIKMLLLQYLDKNTGLLLYLLCGSQDINSSALLHPLPTPPHPWLTD